VGRPVDEHADDLESTVSEDAAEEVAAYPVTGDELDDDADDTDDTAGERDEEAWDDDPAELVTPGAPARNHIPTTVSKITQPNDDVGMNGQIGWPQR
jgi:hypothetical protein